MLALSPPEFNLTLTRALALGLAAVVATLSKPAASLAERRWATSALFRFKPLPVDAPGGTGLQTGDPSSSPSPGGTGVPRVRSASAARTSSPAFDARGVFVWPPPRATDGSASSVLGAAAFSPGSQTPLTPVSSLVDRAGGTGVQPVSSPGDPPLRGGSSSSTSPMTTNSPSNSGATTDGSASGVLAPSPVQIHTVAPLTVPSPPPEGVARGNPQGSPRIGNQAPHDSYPRTAEDSSVSPPQVSGRSLPLAVPLHNITDDSSLPFTPASAGAGAMAEHFIPPRSSPTPISAECEALLTTLGSNRSTREDLLAARRSLRDLLNRGSSAIRALSRRQLELARSFLAPFG
ncbi:MAG: hypothetical protein H7Y88_07770 [Phycisphaerales bacterium]|nr:hypothetical protein [Phycisphaerales bacterium]